MKVSKEQVAQNREALIQAAARLFRERGIDGVGVAEICKHAGLTHGALYAQFPSKEALAAEALADGAARANGWMTARLEGREPTLTDHLDSADGQSFELGTGPPHENSGLLFRALHRGGGGAFHERVTCGSTSFRLNHGSPGLKVRIRR